MSDLKELRAVLKARRENRLRAEAFLKRLVDLESEALNDLLLTLMRPLTRKRYRCVFVKTAGRAK